jgi:hypothetical protein
MQRKLHVKEAGLEPAGFSPVAEMVQSAEVRFLTEPGSRRYGAYHSIRRSAWTEVLRSSEVRKKAKHKIRYCGKRCFCKHTQDG